MACCLRCCYKCCKCCKRDVEPDDNDVKLSSMRDKGKGTRHHNTVAASAVMEAVE